VFDAIEALLTLQNPARFMIAADADTPTLLRRFTTAAKAMAPLAEKAIPASLKLQP
jgi:hypothetical protein